MTGLFLHRGSDAAALADELAGRLDGPRADPFAFDVVVTPHAHVRRWLTNELATRIGRPQEGICAGVRFLSPGGLLRELGEPTPLWRPGRLTWAILAAVSGSEAPELHALRRHLANSPDRYRVGRRIAGLFDHYLHWRPALVTAWESGADVDEAGEPLGFDAWQSVLWRLCAADASPLRAQHQFLAALRDGEIGRSLPDTLSFWAPDSLSPWWAEVLRALAVRRGLHVSLLQVGTAAVPPPPAAPVARLRAAEHAVHAALAGAAAEDQVVEGTPLRPTSVLTWLQARLRGNDPPAPAPDESVHVLTGHGLDRQVEILREQVTALLAADPTLEPRHIVVGCADLPAAAPLISAAFRLPADVPGRHPANDFRVQVADRSSAEVNPLVGVLVQLLTLIESRATASEVIDFCSRPPVAARFGFDVDALERLQQLAAEAGVRWGLNARHRERFGVTGVRQNTWLSGLQRLLLGVALSEDRLPVVGTTLPLDDVEDGDLPSLGGLAELLARLGLFINAAERPAPLAEWVRVLQEALDDFALVSGDAVWQRTDALLRLAELAERGGDTDPLSLADVTALITDEFARGEARSVYGNGSLTVCSLGSLQGVPYRVVCLLGLDDGVFPRRPSRDGDNLMLRAPRLGEPDRPSEDRLALARAVNAAQETLVLVHQGRSATTNQPVPPAALADVLDALHEAGVEARQHPLQPFSPRLFGASGEPLSFDPAGLRGAVALTSPRRAAEESLAVPPTSLPTEVQVSDLCSFAGDPAAFFLRQRCGLSMFERDEPGDDIPLELRGLAWWQVGDRLLSLVLDGADLDEAVRAEWLRGQVPPGALGSRLLTNLSAHVGRIVAALPVPADEPVLHHDVSVDCGPVRVTGRVSTRGDIIVEPSFSKVAPKRLLQLWLRLVTLTAATDRPWRAVLVGRGGQQRFNGPDPALARQVLSSWLRLLQIGLNAPLPVPADFGARLAPMLRDGRDPFAQIADLRAAYTKPGEAWRMFYPRADDLLAVPVGDDDLGRPAETSLACAAAATMWHLLTDHEVGLS